MSKLGLPTISPQQPAYCAVRLVRNKAAGVGRKLKGGVGWEGNTGEGGDMVGEAGAVLRQCKSTRSPRVKEQRGYRGWVVASVC
jgi:hypothetical protein